mgnify:CR=1 FL=1
MKNSEQFFLVFDKDYFDSASEISSNFKISNSNFNFKILRLKFLVRLHTCALQCDPCPGARARAAGDGRRGSRAPELQQCELGLRLESARTALVPVTLSGHAVWVSTQSDWYPTPPAVPNKSCGPLTMLLPTVSGDLAVDAEDPHAEECQRNQGYLSWASGLGRPRTPSRTPSSDLFFGRPAGRPVRIAGRPGGIQCHDTVHLRRPRSIADAHLRRPAGPGRDVLLDFSIAERRVHDVAS